LCLATSHIYLKKKTPPPNTNQLKEEVQTCQALENSDSHPEMRNSISVLQKFADGKVK
jgi:hypothetical protein